MIHDLSASRLRSYLTLIMKDTEMFNPEVMRKRLYEELQKAQYDAMHPEKGKGFHALVDAAVSKTLASVIISLDKAMGRK